VVAISIDASVDRIDTNGLKFQQMGVEERYWDNTIFGHAQESIYAAIALLQDVGWKLISGDHVSAVKRVPAAKSTPSLGLGSLTAYALRSRERTDSQRSRLIRFSSYSCLPTTALTAKVNIRCMATN
jgi:hypothetical protein